MTNLIGLICDGGLAILLVVTIGYCGRLSRRIRLLQDSRGELAGMITQFDQSTSRATASLAELQTVSKRITEALQLKIDKANFLADDLAFLIEKSSKLAGQLEQLKAARAEPAAAPRPKASLPPAFIQTSAPRPKPAATPPIPPAPETPSSARTAAASLEVLLNRLAASSGVTPTPPKPTASSSQPQASAPLRTEAERELLKAIKAGR